ncbi:MAG: hypothetical protein Q9172_001163 [Xanthocarpia lactea]
MANSQWSRAMTAVTHALTLNSFPPGPPMQHYLYLIPDTDLGIEFSPLGQVPRRNEALVKKVIMEGIHDSLEYRVTAKMPGHGYKVQESGFLLSVSHSVGASDLTWGMWTIVLVGINEYVQAYPGYDFQFAIRKFPDEDIEGYVIGAGFAMTRTTRVRV